MAILPFTERGGKLSITLKHIETGEVLQAYSQKDIAKQIGASKGAISKLCKGLLQTAKGWRLA